MISSVVISGKLAEKRGCLRYLASESKKDCYSDDYILSKIPLMYWTRDDSNALINMQKGAFVTCKGRIEHDKTIGLYILVETLEVSK